VDSLVPPKAGSASAAGVASAAGAADRTDASSEQPTIAFERVGFAYGSERPVLRDLSLEIRAGEVFALVGRSGSGKSTALRLINRLALPTTGRVAIEGRSTHDWDPIALRRRAGFVLQDIALFPHMTVAENIGLVARIERWSADRIDARVSELLALVGLPLEFADRWPAEISGGQQQRVGVARALMMDPPILLMDEPFGALDPLTRLSLHRELRRIQSTLRKTIVLVTHDLREAFSLGDRVGVIDEGQLVFEGSPDDLQSSTHPFVREMLDTLELRDAAADHADARADGAARNDARTEQARR
jgi:osmoprotectant transport system ATP-binding protein